MSNSPSQVELYSVRTEAQAQTNADPNLGLNLPGEGIWSSMHLTKSALAHPRVLWKDRLLTVDLYRAGGTYMINLYCPKCLNSLRIEEAHKKIAWSEEDGLSVEEFTCTWELSDTEGRADERIIAGLNLCRWTVGIDPVRKVLDTKEGRVRVHGIAKGG